LFISLPLAALQQGDKGYPVVNDTVKPLLKSPPAESTYYPAFEELKAMLENKTALSFKRAVFLTENAFYDNLLEYESYQRYINALKSFAYQIYKSRKLLSYKAADSINVAMNGAVFSLMKDTVQYLLNESLKSHYPYEYDFNDMFGKKHWDNMFVIKLISTQKGNCHSLPYLYKILADELNATCWLSLAPNHVYVRNYSKQIGWYNTELTSKQFPREGWVMASGYVTLAAVQNGVFMDTLGTKECVAMSLIDLANGYNRKSTSKQKSSFILKCCNLSLSYYPNNITAMLLKAETLKDQYLALQNTEEGKTLFNEMQTLYMRIYHLGYREMPESMYIDWLNSLNTEKEKFIDKKISNTFNRSTK
jgi:hypothetical protein